MNSYPFPRAWSEEEEPDPADLDTLARGWEEETAGVFSTSSAWRILEEEQPATAYAPPVLRYPPPPYRPPPGRTAGLLQIAGCFVGIPALGRVLAGDYVIAATITGVYFLGLSTAILGVGLVLAAGAWLFSLADGVAMLGGSD